MVGGRRSFLLALMWVLLVTCYHLLALSTGRPRVGNPTKEKTSPPFALLDPYDYRQYFPTNASFYDALHVAPFLDLPAEGRYRDVLKAYYYRIRSYRKHIQKTSDDKYWVVTEFLPRVPWAGPENTISAAAGHHILEGRWFWDATEFLEGYIQFWYLGSQDKPGTVQPHISRYTNWIYHATWQYCLLAGTGSTKPLLERTLQQAARVFRTTYVDKYLTNSSRNSELWNTTGRICWTQEDGYDAMEVSVSGGGCRPTIASALWGEAMALVHAAELLGKKIVAKEFQEWASFSKDVLFEQHWNPKIHSFAVIPPWKPSAYSQKQNLLNPNQRDHACNLSDIRIPNHLVDVRELLAFMPWYYASLISPNHPLAATFARQFSWLLESAGKDGLSGPWGLRTIQTSTPCYNYSWEHGDCWNGPSWPYETSRVLTGLANLLSEHTPFTIQISGMSAQTFEHLFLQYARQHTQTEAINDTAAPSGSGHIFENLHPDLGYWNNRARMYWKNDTMKDMGDDYNHSTFLDLVFSAWLGIRLNSDQQDWLVIHPLIQAPYFAADRIPYRGRAVSILYDPDGTHYPNAVTPGLVILVDGQAVASRSDLGRLAVTNEPPRQSFDII